MLTDVQVTVCCVWRLRVRDSQRWWEWTTARRLLILPDRYVHDTLILPDRLDVCDRVLRSWIRDPVPFLPLDPGFRYDVQNHMRLPVCIFSVKIAALGSLKWGTGRIFKICTWMFSKEQAKRAQVPKVPIYYNKPSKKIFILWVVTQSI